jgi:hypothetical protein
MRAAAVLSLVAVGALARPAFAFEDYEGTRALGMGSATRAWALGGTGPLLNPSGMSLAKLYNVEAAYAYASRLSAQSFHASIVDSTSASTLAGGLYYTYRMDKVGGVEGHGHEAGAALSLPFASYFAFGATLKYFRLGGPDQGAALSSGGLTFDLGATVRPISQLSLGVVGTNLSDLHVGHAPQMIGYGVAFVPVSDLVLAVDGLTTFTRDEVTHLRGTGVRAGAEGTLAQRVTIRAGGGTDPMLGVGYLAAGASLLSEIAAVDVGVRGDLWTIDAGSTRNVFLGVSLRLLMGTAATESASPSP